MDIYRKQRLRIPKLAYTPQNSPYVSLYTINADEHPEHLKQAKIEDFIALGLPGADYTLLEEISSLDTMVSPCIFYYLLAHQDSAAGMFAMLHYLELHSLLHTYWLSYYPLTYSSVQIFAHFVHMYAFASEFINNARSILAAVQDYSEALFVLRQAMIQLYDMFRAAGVPETPKFAQLRNCLRDALRRPLNGSEMQLAQLIQDDFNVVI